MSDRFNHRVTTCGKGRTQAVGVRLRYSPGGLRFLSPTRLGNE